MRVADGMEHCRLSLPIFPSHASFGQNDRLMAILDMQSRIHLWDVEKGREVLRMQAPFVASAEMGKVAFTPDGHFLMLHDGRSPLHVLDLAGLQRELTALGLGW